MMNEIDTQEEYEVAFKLISVAGTAKSEAMESIEKYREFNFAEGDMLLEQAEKTYLKSHVIQSGLLFKEAQGHRESVNVFLVHAQDHLTMANMAIENAKEFKEIYRMIDSLSASRKEG